MKKMVLAIASLMICLSAAAQQPYVYENYVAVNGHAEREISPNEIYISITLDDTSGKGKMSIDAQEQRMIDELKLLGIDVEKKLQIVRMASDLQTYWLKKDKIQTTKRYTLEINDAELVGFVFATLADLNISQVNITRTSHSDIEKIKDELRVEAVKKAKQTASDLAGALGQKIGKAVYIEDYDSRYVTANFDFAEFSEDVVSTKAAQRQPSNLQFKKIKLSCNVNVKFALL